jgi:hypothetical protein
VENEKQGDVARIPVRDLFVLVDRRRFAELCRYRWNLLKRRGRPGAVTRSGTKSEGRKTIFMHRQILNAPDGVWVDHINGNPLDNRRCNLRLVSARQNQMNRGPNLAARPSRFKGVTRERGKWVARIHIELIGKRRNLFLGEFRSEEDAAQVYNEAAKELFGEYARPNGATSLFAEKERRYEELLARYEKLNDKYGAAHEEGRRGVARSAELSGLMEALAALTHPDDRFYGPLVEGPELWDLNDAYHRAVLYFDKLRGEG